MVIALLRGCGRVTVNEVLAVEDVAYEVRVIGVDAVVDDGDSLALALSDLPSGLGIQRLQRPLIVSCLISCRVRC
jgi:hypothetical protein